jgi:hypothetical protein
MQAGRAPYEVQVPEFLPRWIQCRGGGLHVNSYSPGSCRFIKVACGVEMYTFTKQHQSFETLYKGFWGQD